MNIILWILVPIWVTWLVYISYCICMGLFVYEYNHSKSIDYGNRAITANIAVIAINMVVVLIAMLMRLK